MRVGIVMHFDRDRRKKFTDAGKGLVDAGYDVPVLIKLERRVVSLGDDLYKPCDLKYPDPREGDLVQLLGCNSTRGALTALRWMYDASEQFRYDAISHRIEIASLSFIRLAEGFGFAEARVDGMPTNTHLRFQRMRILDPSSGFLRRPTPIELANPVWRQGQPVGYLRSLHASLKSPSAASWFLLPGTDPA